MACTTILIGKNASYDGSTIIARNEDCEDGDFNPKRLVAVDPSEQPRTYTGVNSHLTIELPDNPLRYTCAPDVDLTNGIWGEAGINDANVAMTATETITTNSNVLGADPLVAYVKSTDTPGGIGEEDLVTIVLPYIHTAREGVQRLGDLLATYGTYEENGIGFADGDEVWWLETVGGHHWIARRLPDDCYAIVPNQLGIDYFDLADAYGDQRDFMCSPDLADWMKQNGLVPAAPEEGEVLCEGIPAVFNPRLCFGSDTWRDHVYNTPRAWYAQSILNPTDAYFGPDAEFRPEDSNLPWCRVPEHRITMGDVKRVLAAHYQNTEFDPYGSLGTEESRRRYRVIGINRTCEMSALQVNSARPEALRSVQWLALGSGPFNTMVPVFTHVGSVPAYLHTHEAVNTDELYWQNRLVAALADPEYYAFASTLASYQQATIADGLASVAATVRGWDGNGDDADAYLEQANERICDKVRSATDELLSQALYARSMAMRNAFRMQDH